MLTSDVENFPGYPKGIGGPEMMIDMREQAERFGLEVQDKNVERVDLSQRPFGVWVEGEEFEAFEDSDDESKPAEAAEESGEVATAAA